MRFHIFELKTKYHNLIVINYSFFLSQIPSNGGGYGEDCGETWTGTTWNDGLCNHEQPSICEMI